MVVIGGWSILQDCARGDWFISSAAVGRLKDALLLRLNLDQPEMAAAWIKPELPFLLDAIRRMIPFIDGSAVPQNTTRNGGNEEDSPKNKTTRQQINQGATVHDGRLDYKHIEWTQTNAAQCIALCWSMGAAVRIVETTEGVDLIEKVVDCMQQASATSGAHGAAAAGGKNILDNSGNSDNSDKPRIANRFRGQCVGALAVLRISLSVEIKPSATTVYDMNTTAIRKALVQKIDSILATVQQEFPNVQAILKTHGSAGASSATFKQTHCHGVHRWVGLGIWVALLLAQCGYLWLWLSGRYLNHEHAKQLINRPKFHQYSCGTITMLALVYVYGNAVFGWNDIDSATSDLGALTNFVLQTGGGARTRLKTTKVS